MTCVYSRIIHLYESINGYINNNLSNDNISAQYKNTLTSKFDKLFIMLDVTDKDFHK